MWLFAGNGLWYLISQTDTLTRVVLGLLLTVSLLCWTIFLAKMIILLLKQRQLKKVEKRIKHITSVQDLLVLATESSGTLPGYYLSKTLVSLKALLVVDKIHAMPTMTQRQWEIFQQHAQQTIDDVIMHEESYLAILSTSAAVSPLLGLFGTVWGLIHAFMSIADKQTADIATIAPGIAQALTTTLAGLLVAIPALVMFNVCQMQLRSIEQRLIIIADKVILTGHQLVAD